MGKSQELYDRAKKIIPGGTQLLSKRPEMFLPDYWPAYYSKSKGCEIWDLDNNKYYDMSYMGVGANVLGYCDDDVDKKVIDAIQKGNNTTLNAPEEVELADLLLDLHPWADMVRYTRTGGEAMAVAIRIARAKTKKEKVLFCGYHGWHDWYLASNLAENDALDGHLLPGLQPNGVPRSLKGTSFPFEYNNVESFLELLDKHADDTAAVALESIRNYKPTNRFLETIREETKKRGIILIVDEITAGFRFTNGGAHLLFNLEPDIATFGKAMSNGYAMAAIIGKKKIMESAQDSFISSLFWTDKIGPVSAIATIKKIKELNVTENLDQYGLLVKKGWKKVAELNKLDISIEGQNPIPHFSFNNPQAIELKTIFTKEMLKKGFLATTAYYASLAHSKAVINKYLEAVSSVFSFINNLINKNEVTNNLKGPKCHSGFKRLT